MKRFTAALTATCAVLLGLMFTGVTPASANAIHSKTVACYGTGTSATVSAEYYHYLDGGNNWRARLVKTTFTYVDGVARNFTGTSTFFSLSGQAWSQSTPTFGSSLTIYAPSQANGLLQYNPKSMVHGKYGANDCGADLNLYG